MTTPARAKPCPICKKPGNDAHTLKQQGDGADKYALKQQGGSADKYAPFCSARCRDRDLAQWFGDGYAVPGRPATPDEIAGEIVRQDLD